MSGSTPRYLFVKHSKHWNVDRCTRWMGGRHFDVDWCYPVSGEIFPDPSRYLGVVVFGGANSANDCSDHDWVRRELVFAEQCLAQQVPYLGICLGAQMLARVLGAAVQAHEHELKEVGFLQVDPVPDQAVFLNEPLTVMQWHSEGFDLPPDTHRLATGERFPNQAYQLNESVLGLQFHPEVNAEVLAIWLERNRQRVPEQLTHEQRCKMIKDAHYYDDSVSQWLDGLLSRWTDECRQRASLSVSINF